MDTNYILNQHIHCWTFSNKWYSIPSSYQDNNPFVLRLSNHPEVDDIQCKYAIQIPEESKYSKKITELYAKLVSEGFRLPVPAPKSRLSTADAIAIAKEGNNGYSFKNANTSDSGYCDLTLTVKQSRKRIIDTLSDTFIICDDANLTFLKALHENGLTCNIIHVDVVNRVGNGKPKEQVLKLINVPTDTKLEKTVPSDAPLTKVMSTQINEHDITDEEWHSLKRDTFNGKYVRITFKMKNTGKDATKYIFGEFKNNDVLPLRFNWNTGYGKNRKIIGGSVICPYEHFTKFSNKLKLFNVNSMNYYCDFNMIRNSVVEYYDTIS